jgi:hypothetical protein
MSWTASGSTVERVLLIQRSYDGLYWAPGVETHSTTPGWVTDPATALRIVPCNRKEFDAPHGPNYYVENSTRMRYWLKGTRTVRAEIKTTIEVKLL